ncbi:MAG: hypothetical protein RLZZ399_950 [Verrucomicrobiota bacterium]|jgi:CheY-like chemotaxis protein
MLPEPRTPHPPDPLRSAKILLVDDEPLILVILCGFLESTAAHISEASSAEEALKACDRDQFDLVITDRFMPGLDGIELSRTLKQRDPAPRVILISGMNGKLETEPERGPDAFLPKPFSRDELLRTIREVLGGARQG